MLDKKYTDAYKSVRASESLKEKILLQAEENLRKRRPGSAVRYGVRIACAACFALMIGIGIFAMYSGRSVHTEVMYNSEPIGVNAAIIRENSARAFSFGEESVNAGGLPLEIRTASCTKISVTDGELLVFDGDYEELLFVGTNFTTDGSVLLYWDLSDGSLKEPGLIIDSENEHLEYVIQESSENGYVIRLTVKETH